MVAAVAMGVASKSLDGSGMHQCEFFKQLCHVWVWVKVSLVNKLCPIKKKRFQSSVKLFFFQLVTYGNVLKSTGKGRGKKELSFN